MVPRAWFLILATALLAVGLDGHPNAAGEPPNVDQPRQAAQQTVNPCEPVRLPYQPVWPNPQDPVSVVCGLYSQVMAHQPLGLPDDATMKTLAPYLSKALRHRLELARACYEEWVRQHPDPGTKPPFGWLGGGLFTGEEAQASPPDFQLEKPSLEKSGGIRVTVRLSSSEPPAKPRTWRVAVILIRENGRAVVSDVIYVSDEHRIEETKLSEYLCTGCDGSLAMETEKREQRYAQDTQVRGVWTDPATGLMWAGKDNGKDVTWNQAMSYCRDLRLAGHSDWRLATLAELEGIHDGSADSPGWARMGTPTGKPFTWHVKGNLFLTGENWSATRIPDDRGKPSGYAWRFDFNEGRSFGGDEISFYHGKRALCVRGPEK